MHECMVSHYKDNINDGIEHPIHPASNWNTNQILILGGGWWVSHGKITFILPIHNLGQYLP